MNAAEIATFLCRDSGMQADLRFQLWDENLTTSVARRCRLPYVLGLNPYAKSLSDSS